MHASIRSVAMMRWHDARNGCSLRCTRRKMQNLQRSHVAACSSSADKGAYNERQSKAFDSQSTVSIFEEPLPADVQERLHTIVNSVPSLGSESRVIDVGSGTGCLIPHLRQRGVQDILAVDLSEHMLQTLQARYGSKSTVGNEPGVRTWLGDFTELPPFLGTADTILMNAVFGNFFSQREALIKASFLLKPGGHLVLSHPMGRAWHAGLRAGSPELVAHDLPDQQALQEMVQDLPLHVASFTDEAELYNVLLQVPPKYALRGGPVQLSGPVVAGFGRGSRQLGVPTANIDPPPLLDQLKRLPKGVYFGWAKLDAAPGAPAEDSAVHKMVMNIGSCPTVKEGDADVTVEAHILHKYQEDFYGKNLKVVALGYIRPEMKFSGLQSLLTRIKTDIGIAKNQLDDPAYAGSKSSL